MGWFGGEGTTIFGNNPLEGLKLYTPRKLNILHLKINPSKKEIPAWTSSFSGSIAVCVFSDLKENSVPSFH